HEAEGLRHVLLRREGGKEVEALNTKPMWRRRRSLRASSDRRVNSWPPTITRPCVGVSSPAIRLRSVLLPEPLGPMMERNWLAGTCRLTALNAVNAWPASP